MTKEQGVVIHWVDSMSSEHWEDRDHANNFDNRIQTLGWLINETDDSYIVSAHVSEMGQCCSLVKIPKISVIGFWLLEMK